MPKTITGMNSIIIDAFRIIAAYMVLFGHGFSFFQLTIFKNQDNFLYIQEAGVVILFVLSGFLITHSLETKNVNHDYQFRDFIKNRLMRIGKGYILALLFIIVIDSLNIYFNGEEYSYLQGFSLFNLVGNLCMLQSLPIPILGRVFVPFGSGRQLWTMAIEWWIYMAYAFTYLTIVNKKTISLIRALALVLVGYFPIRDLVGGSGNGLTLCFLLGVAIYYLYDKLSISNYMVLICLCTLCIIIYGILKKAVYEIFFFVLVFAMLLILLSWGNKREGKTHAFISLLARSTYMLYLVHYSIMDLFVHLNLGISNRGKFIISIFVSICVALLFYTIFEKRKFKFFHIVGE